MTPVNCYLLIVLIRSVDARSDSLLGLFGFNTGRAGTVNRIPLDDITSQSLGLLNYIRGIQRSPNNNLQKKISEPLPQVTLLDGLPAVPGLMGSLPGIGGCLPAKMPLVSQTSPNFFQNFLRFIPGAQDYLVSLVETPNINTTALMGRYQWIVSTAGVHDRYCPTTEFKNLLEKGNTSSFSTVDSFHEENAKGPAKVGFGYGILHNQRAYIYFQEDPCPYQIIMIGPQNMISGQYEYIVLSNWAKYPTIAMARDIGEFSAKYRNVLVERFKREGYIHELSDFVGNSVNFVDWTQCKPLTPISFVSDIVNRFLFG
uniref:COesterase domain-containing protein n=1 Tax=Ascaris lumbricoides TaxID=6252 RepID=A0A0M3HPM6_ASCLU